MLQIFIFHKKLQIFAKHLNVSFIFFLKECYFHSVLKLLCDSFHLLCLCGIWCSSLWKVEFKHLFCPILYISLLKVLLVCKFQTILMTFLFRNMDFNLDGNFNKISSSEMGTSDLDFSSSLRRTKIIAKRLFIIELGVEALKSIWLKG